MTLDEDKIRERLKEFETDCEEVKALAAELGMDKVTANLDSRMNETKEAVQATIARPNLEEANQTGEKDAKKKIDALLKEAEEFADKGDEPRMIDKLKEARQAAATDDHPLDDDTKTRFQNIPQKADQIVRQMIADLLETAKEYGGQGHHELMENKLEKAMQLASTKEDMHDPTWIRAEEIRKEVQDSIEAKAKAKEQADKKTRKENVEALLKEAEEAAEKSEVTKTHDKLIEAKYAAAGDALLSEQVKVRAAGILAKVDDEEETEEESDAEKMIETEAGSSATDEKESEEEREKKDNMLDRLFGTIDQHLKEKRLKEARSEIKTAEQIAEDLGQSESVKKEIVRLLNKHNYKYTDIFDK
ncbi:hypothetical protein ACFL3V_04755 [Nanoarchaeota archaeon]